MSIQKAYAVLLVTLISIFCALCSGDLGNERIVGGIEAPVGSHPPMVFLPMEIDGKLDGCGASLLTQTLILTAAHCCVLNFTEAIAGVHNTSSPDEYWQRRNIVETFVHPDFNKCPHAYDLCVLHVDVPFELNSRVNTTTLTNELVPADSVVTLFGWGRTSYQGERPEALLTTNFSVVDFDVCNEAWVHLLHPESMLCVAMPEKSPCHGDSGGPLVWTREGHGTVQVGIVSWGWKCGHPELPGIFGDVAKNIAWIVNTAERLGQQIMLA